MEWFMEAWNSMSGFLTALFGGGLMGGVLGWVAKDKKDEKEKRKEAEKQLEEHTFDGA